MVRKRKDIGQEIESQFICIFNEISLLFLEY
jgi:hypothetical protein